MTVCVVGAGVTGLAVAYLLRRRGMPVHVFEAGSGEGGLAGTFQKDGFFFDYGPHEFCTENPELVRLLEEVCGKDLRVVQKRAAQCFRGRLVRYPFEIVDVVRNVHPVLMARAFASLVWARVRFLGRKLPAESFESWTRAHFGSALYDMYFGPYTRKVWGVHPNELDARTAAQRITVESVRDLLKKMVSYHWLKGADYKKTHSEFRRDFYYTRHGTGTLQANLRRSAEALGVQFAFNKKLRKLDVEGSEIRKLHFEDGSSAEGFTSVVSTIPLPHLVRLARPDDAEELLRANHLSFRGMIFLFVRVNKPQLTDNHWIYFSDPEVPFQRITDFAHFEAEMSPAGTTGLAIEIAANRGDANWSTPDDQLLAKVQASLKNLGLLEPEDVIGCDVVRTEYAYPIQVRGYLEKSEALLRSLRNVENLVSIGRQGLFRYCNQNECIEMAFDLVPQILEGRRSILYTGEGSWQGIGRTDRYHAAKTKGN